MSSTDICRKLRRTQSRRLRFQLPLTMPYHQLTILLVLACLLLPSRARSQVQGMGWEPSADDRGSVRGWMANDVFYLPLKTDRYYSSGMALEYAKYAQAGDKTITRNWKLEHAIFTPEDIVSTGMLSNDRPYAGYLTLERGVGWSDEKGVSFSQHFTGGVLGKYAMGEWVQNTWHSYLSYADDIPGWPNQVKPDVIVNYQALIDKDWLPNRQLTLATYGRGRVGTLFTDVTAGARVVWTLPITRNPERYFTVGASQELRAVGYNATLSGGLFNRDDRFRGVVRPERLVSLRQVRLALRYGQLGLEASGFWLSPEFRGGREHAYVRAGMQWFW